jgi:hypothetical protein
VCIFTSVYKTFVAGNAIIVGAGRLEWMLLQTSLLTGYLVALIPPLEIPPSQIAPVTLSEIRFFAAVYNVILECYDDG